MSANNVIVMTINDNRLCSLLSVGRGTGNCVAATCANVEVCRYLLIGNNALRHLVNVSAPPSSMGPGLENVLLCLYDLGIAVHVLT